MNQTSTNQPAAPLPALERSSNTNARTWGKRVVFFLLAIWLHCALLFFLVMDLFKGHDLNPQDASNTKEQQVVSVDLRPAPPPKEEEVPKPQADPLPKSDAQAPTPAKPDEELKTEKTAEKATPEKSAEKHAEEHGILSCSALTKKPERVVYGEDRIQYMPDDGSTSGYVILRETISRTGEVIKVTVEESTLPKKLEEQAVTWAYRKVYHPGEIGGVPVDCEFRYMVSTSQP